MKSWSPNASAAVGMLGGGVGDRLGFESPATSSGFDVEALGPFFLFRRRRVELDSAEGVETECALEGGALDLGVVGRERDVDLEGVPIAAHYGGSQGASALKLRDLKLDEGPNQKVRTKMRRNCSRHSLRRMRQKNARTVD